MAITDIRQVRGRSGNEDEDGFRGFTEVYSLTSDTMNEQTYTVLSHPGLPERGDPHPEVDAAYVVSRKPTQESNPFLWTVTIEYSTKLGDEHKPAQIEWGTKRVEAAWVYDEATGEPVKNSAGEPFKDLKAEEIVLTLRIKRVELEYDPVRALGFIDCTNRDEFFGFQPGEVRCTNLTGRTTGNDATATKYEVTYEFEIKAGGWLINLLDQGSYEIVPGANPRKFFYTNGTNKPTLNLLDGHGRKLWDGATLPQPAPVFLPFTKYPPAGFHRLDLP